MAQLGCRTIDELVGRVDRLKVRAAIDHWKAKGLDYSAILHEPRLAPGTARGKSKQQDNRLEQPRANELIAACRRALNHQLPVTSSGRSPNRHRAVGPLPA